MNQLPLDLAGPRPKTSETFVDGPPYDAAQALLADAERWPRRALVLYGPEACGKSHLGAVWARAHRALVVDGRALSEDAVRRGAQAPAVLCDDADHAGDERALLHLVNTAHEAGAPLLLIARTPARGWAMSLADLRSRLLAMGSVGVADTPDAPAAPPDDSFARRLLARRLRDGGVEARPEVIDYLLARTERSFSALDRLAGAAERWTLQERRALTKPLAAQILAEASSAP